MNYPVIREKITNFSRILVTILLLTSSILCSTAIPAHAEPAQTIPEPSGDFYYNDQANILSGETKSLILTKNAALAPNSVQLVVLTMDTLPVEGYTQRVEYLQSVMDSWQVGGPEKRGLLLALSVSDADYLAVAGEGIRAQFTSDLLKSMLDSQLELDFNSHSYDAGVTKFITEAANQVQTLLPAQDRQTAAEPEKSSPPWGVIISLPAAAVCIAIFAFYRRPGRRRSSRHRIHRHAPLVTPPRTTVLRHESRTPMTVRTSHRSDGPTRVRKL